MDPCPFVRLIVESLALKLPPVTAKPAGSGIHPSNTPCFCTLQLQNLSSSASSSATSLKTVPLPLSSDSSTSDNITVAAPSPPSSSAFASSSPPVVFNLDPTALQRLSGRPATLTASVYSGRTGSTCGFSSGRLLGRVRVSVDLEAALVRPVVMQSGWATVGKETAATGPAPRLYLVLRSEPEPRFVFQFGGEPECSPVVYQIHNGSGSTSLRQPVFSCKFSADRRSTSARSLPLDPHDVSANRGSTVGCWGVAFGGHRAQLRREQQQQRKGWTVTIHDLSGSPVAAASMVTPFVPSPGSDRVSRSNPGAWLILQPTGLCSATSWKPWGRLESWRERGPTDALGYRLDLVDDPTNGGVTIAQSAISIRKGGEFCIDAGAVGDAASRWPSPFVVRGFVMESTVEGEGKVSKPTVQVGVQHVRCMADAALFVALGAAIDLSMDACRLFSQKLRKELCQDHQDFNS